MSSQVVAGLLIQQLPILDSSKVQKGEAITAVFRLQTLKTAKKTVEDSCSNSSARTKGRTRK